MSLLFNLDWYEAISDSYVLTSKDLLMPSFPRRSCPVLQLHMYVRAKHECCVKQFVDKRSKKVSRDKLEWIRVPNRTVHGSIWKLFCIVFIRRPMVVGYCTVSKLCMEVKGWPIQLPSSGLEHMTAVLCLSSFSDQINTVHFMLLQHRGIRRTYWAFKQWDQGY